MRKSVLGQIGWLVLGVCLPVFAGLLPKPLPALSQEAPAAADPYRVGGNVSRPEKISGNPPVYTEMARKARLQGVVIIEAIIDENGDVINTRVLKGLPMGLDKAAVDAVGSWKFKPALLDGKQPVKVYYILTVNFQVEGGSYGPIFVQLLASHPDFAAALSEKRYDEAAALLDRLDPRPSAPEITLARAHLLLAEGRHQDAWELARRERSANPASLQEELALAVAQSALREIYRRQESDAADLVELGLEATEEALKAVPRSLPARAVRLNLLEAKRRAADDEAESEQIAREIERLRAEVEAQRESSTSSIRDPESIRRVGGPVTEPEKISGDPHEYTEIARRARLQGMVIVELIVSEEGDVKNARILKGLPMGLSEQALAAVKTYKFRPALENGKPVRVYTRVTVDFRLE